MIVEVGDGFYLLMAAEHEGVFPDPGGGFALSAVSDMLLIGTLSSDGPVLVLSSKWDVVPDAEFDDQAWEEQVLGSVTSTGPLSVRNWDCTEPREYEGPLTEEGGSWHVRVSARSAAMSARLGLDPMETHFIEVWSADLED